MKSSLHFHFLSAGCFWSWVAVQHTMENHDRLRRKNLTTEQKICKTPINTKAKIKLAGIATMAIILVIGIMKKTMKISKAAIPAKLKLILLISTIPNS